MNEPNNQQSQELFAQLADDYLKENKRKRRWGIFFKILFFIWLFGFLYTVFPTSTIKENISQPHSALIDIRGTIFDKSSASADNITKGLRKAYADSGTKGIILRINSPGGSPVQASYIYNEIRRLKKLHPKIKVYAVCTDACASAAYFIAAAADEIYANPSSLVGSIGVLYDGFGFVGTLDKLGVQRRLMTAGKNKGFMDPFSPVDASQKQKLQDMLDSIHNDFQQSVITGRGKRLIQSPDIFSGLFWTGTQAKKLGLIDGFASAGKVARDFIKQEKVVDYTETPNYFERFARQFGESISGEIFTQMSGSLR